MGEGATPCEPSECQRVHRSLRAWLRECFGEETLQCRFLYTGPLGSKRDPMDGWMAPQEEGSERGEASDTAKRTSRKGVGHREAFPTWRVLVVVGVFGPKGTCCTRFRRFSTTPQSRFRE